MWPCTLLLLMNPGGYSAGPGPVPASTCLVFPLYFSPPLTPPSSLSSLTVDLSSGSALQALSPHCLQSGNTAVGSQSGTRQWFQVHTWPFGQ